MKISALIAALVEIEARHGDIDVANVVYNRGGTALRGINEEAVAVFARTELADVLVEDAVINHPYIQQTPFVTVLTDFERCSELTRY